MEGTLGTGDILIQIIEDKILAKDCATHTCFMHLGAFVYGIVSFLDGAIQLLLGLHQVGQFLDLLHLHQLLLMPVLPDVDEQVHQQRNHHQDRRDKD